MTDGIADDTAPITRVAILTGSPYAGKSTLVRSIRNQVPVLESDIEVLGRIFEILHVPRFKAHIKPLGGWQHLRKQFDFDRLFRVHHRDWFARVQMAEAIVLEGWIYCFKEWRNLVRSAFSQIQFRRFEYRLFVLQPNLEEFFRRFQSGVHERNSGRLPPNLLQLSSSQYADFQRELEIPGEEEQTSTERYESGAELWQSIKSFYGAPRL